jgi:hypothetical protein
MSLGENTNKRNNDWERKRRVVLTEEENPPRNEWSPYKNLPIAPGLPEPRSTWDEESISMLISDDILFPKGISRDTCADIRKYDGKQCEGSFDLSKIREVSRRLGLRDTCADIRKYDEKQCEVSFDSSKIGEELEDDGLNGIETYFPDFESFNGYFPDFTAFNYKAERFDEGDWPEFDVIE